MKNKKITTVIDDVNSKGQGVAHIDGLAIFIDEALAGEQVEIMITEKKKSYARGDLLRIKKPSKERVEPRCPYFGKCGGCQLQHLSIKGQLAYKKKRIQNALYRIAGIKIGEDFFVEPSENFFFYRNKVLLPATPSSLNGSFLGFYKKNSHSIVPIKRCYLHLKEIKPIFDALNALIAANLIPIHEEKSKKGILRHVYIRLTEHKKEAVVCFIVTKNAPFLTKIADSLTAQFSSIKGVFYVTHSASTNGLDFSDARVLCGQSFYQENFMGLTINLSVGAFFQVNTKQAQKIYAWILENGGFRACDFVVDAYCGIGTLTLLIARKVRRVLGIECYEPAIEDANTNKKINGIFNADFKVGLAEDLIPTIEKIDCIFLNPPRKGCALDVLEAIGNNAIQRVIYMSCDPATLARDIKVLSDYGYVVQKIQGFDMFCHTTHVETLVFLQKS